MAFGTLNINSPEKTSFTTDELAMIKSFSDAKLKGLSAGFNSSLYGDKAAYTAALKDIGKASATALRVSEITSKVNNKLEKSYATILEERKRLT